MTLIRPDVSQIAYTHPAAGGSARTLDEKLWDAVSIKDFGAVGDGVTDDSAAFAAAFAYIGSIGGGSVEIPLGTYRKSDLTATLVVPSNCTLWGHGDGSVIFHDDTIVNPRMDLLSCSITENVTLRDFRITGTLMTHLTETNQSQTLTGNDVDNLRVLNVTIEEVRYMATGFRDVRGAQIRGCHLRNIARDGLRCTNSWNVVIDGNVLVNVADDAIAVHSVDSYTLPGLGCVISNNVIEGSQGIKVLGAKAATIKSNTLRRTTRGPIHVVVNTSSVEGNSNMFSVNISDNMILDTFSNMGTDYAIRVDGGTYDAGAETDEPGVNAPVFEFNYINDLLTGTQVRLPGFGLIIRNNTVSRTLPTVAAYSDWGFGEQFDKNSVGFYQDPAVTREELAVHGIMVEAPLNGCLIDGNILTGGTPGNYAIQMTVGEATFIRDFSNVRISNNMILDWPSLGVNLTSTGAGDGGKEVILQNNTFDLDPFYRADDHAADNTWTSTSTVVAIRVQNTIGFLAGGNVFKNCGATGLSSSGTVMEAGPNIVYAEFVAAGDDAGNKGVRLLPSARTNLIIPIDGDPTSATYGHATSIPRQQSIALPTSGDYVESHFVSKAGVAVAGGGGSQYVILGWVRVTTGSGHTLNTDWVEVRALTGT